MGVNVEALCKEALDANQGLLRLAPTWVPRSFLQPGRRLKLHPDDLYALGTDRGGIDERWFASTTVAENEGAPDDEGLSYVVYNGDRFLFREAIQACGAAVIGEDLWNTYKGWPVYSKFFDNMGPIPHHLHQGEEKAGMVGCQGKPESYYFPPQLNNVGNNFPYTFFGLEPGTTREDVRRCLERWTDGDNGILDLSKAYRLRPGTGWLVDPEILHAPGSLLTYEPQWASDVFGMYQSIVEGRVVPWDLLGKNMPETKHQDLDFILDTINWEKNTDPMFREHHYLEPIPDGDTESAGYVDRWVVYGKIDGKQLFSAKELTVNPGAKVTIKDGGPSGLITVQGRGRINNVTLECPALIRFGQMTEDEVFITADAATNGLTFENHSDKDPLVCLRYFGPDTHSATPQLGDYRN